MAFCTARLMLAACLSQFSLLVRAAAGAQCPKPKDYDKPCRAVPFEGKRRVRREVMDLSLEEWQRVVDAMWVMKNTSTEDGERMYGASFKSYDYFLVKHTVASADSRGDQGHFSDAFPTFHAAWLLEFENTLLAIDPRIAGLPYWSSNNGDSFTDAYLGSIAGTGENGIVIDGKFAGWPVTGNFSIDDWSSYLKKVPGAHNNFVGNAAGFARGETTPLETKVTTRFGKSYVFPEKNFSGCIATTGCYTEWFQCMNCLDLECLRGGPCATCPFGMLHSVPHFTIGGSRQIGAQKVKGDFADPISSPNDPLFPFHHANTERSRVTWMAAHPEQRDVYYGYGGVIYKCLGIYQACPSGGIALGDVISAQFPFTSEQLGLTGLTSEGVTHADVLCFLGPDTAPYEYVAPGAGKLMSPPPPPPRQQQLRGRP